MDTKIALQYSRERLSSGRLRSGRHRSPDQTCPSINPGHSPTPLRMTSASTAPRPPENLPEATSIPALPPRPTPPSGQLPAFRVSHPQSDPIPERRCPACTDPYTIPYTDTDITTEMKDSPPDIRWSRRDEGIMEVSQDFFCIFYFAIRYSDLICPENISERSPSVKSFLGENGCTFCLKIWPVKISFLRE